MRPAADLSGEGAGAATQEGDLDHARSEDSIHLEETYDASRL